MHTETIHTLHGIFFFFFVVLRTEKLEQEVAQD